jgi:hypothetical protein
MDFKGETHPAGAARKIDPNIDHLRVQLVRMLWISDKIKKVLRILRLRTS